MEPHGRTPDRPRSLTYLDAGVDIDAGNRAVELMKEHVRSTYRPEVLGDIGGFGGFFRVPGTAGPGSRVLVGAADGVGSKLKIAFLMNRHDTVGIDLVAMNVNDLITTGAEPLFFLDYIGVGRLAPKVIASVVSGVAAGCREAGCALIGGETAELPDFYAPGEYDLAGFAVGMVDEAAIISGTTVRAGMVILGLHSSGLHSNGFSLVRRVLFDVAGMRVDETVEELGTTLGAELLKPTSIYVKALRVMREHGAVHAAAHITGGGLVENLPRVLPGGLGARIHTSAWTPQPIFRLLQHHGNLEENELWRTFNMGIGMAVVIDEADVDAMQKTLRDMGQENSAIGTVMPHESGPRIVFD